MPQSASPIVVAPLLEPKPWGGRRLAHWGIVLPSSEAIGEAHLAASQVTVASGALAGLSLDELARRDPDTWIGRRGLEATCGRAIFPLLIKLIAAETDLSIQVHPDDRAAAAAGLGTGKTEAYFILAAEAGSVIFLGLEPGLAIADLAAACRRGDGTAPGLLRQIPAEAGMTVLIPAGTVHALGAGITVYEIQQPSNTTYRLDDWGRVDAAGASRALHHDQGFAVAAPHMRPESIPPVTLAVGAARRDLLVATPYFALERFAIAASGVATLDPVESPQALTCIKGDVVVDAPASEIALSLGETAVVPAQLLVALRGSSNGVVLRGWVPDLEHDVRLPARAAGVQEKLLQRLIWTPPQSSVS